MNNEAQTQQEEAAMITLEGEDGHSYPCQLLDIFQFEEQEYALLLKMDELKASEEGSDEEDEGSLVVMRLIQRDDQSIFQTIESEDEFARVVAHLEDLARSNEQHEIGGDE